MKKSEKSGKKRGITVRRIVYVTVAFCLFQMDGFFSKAGVGGLYVFTEDVSNVMNPIKYTDIDLEEPDGDRYEISENGTVTNSQGEKYAYVSIRGANKKSVVIRAKIILEKYNADGIMIGTMEPDQYRLTQSTKAAATEEENAWYEKEDTFYYTSVLQAEERTTNLFDQVTITDSDDIPKDGSVRLYVLVDSLEVETGEDGKPTDASLQKVKQCWKQLPDGIWSGS